MAKCSVRFGGSAGLVHGIEASRRPDGVTAGLVTVLGRGLPEIEKHGDESGPQVSAPGSLR